MTLKGRGGHPGGPTKVTERQTRAPPQGTHCASRRPHLSLLERPPIPAGRDGQGTSTILPVFWCCKIRLRVCGKGGKVVLVPLPRRSAGPSTTRSRAGCAVPFCSTAVVPGWTDRHAATRRPRQLAQHADYQAASPYAQAHLRDDDAKARSCIRCNIPGLASGRRRKGWLSGYNEAAIAATEQTRRSGSRNRTALRQVPGCCVHSGCIRRKHDAAKATKNRGDEGRCHYRPVMALTHSAWLVIRSLPV